MPESSLLIAAVDQGSSSTKGSVLTTDGQRLAEISVPVSLHSSGRNAHHDPDEIAASVSHVLDHLLERYSVDAVGLTCQRSTCLLWDRDSGQALTSALSWQDTSQVDRVDTLARHAPDIHLRTGLRLSPHYAATKLARLFENLPRGRQRAERGEIVGGTLDAFLVRQLTGNDTTEPGHAGRTLLFDLETANWSEELTELFGVPRPALPTIGPSAGHRGTYRGVPLTAVAGDQQAALLGHGGWASAVTAVHFGTGAFVLTGTGEQHLLHPAALTAVLASTVERTVFQIEATVNSAGSAVDWACRMSGERLDEWQQRELDPAELPQILPAFRGVGAPWWRPEARAAVAGLTLESSPSDLLGATLAGVAMRVLDCVELLSSIAPSQVLRVSGKLTRLAGITGLLADAGQLTVERAEDEEVGLLGIARLAVAGLTGSEHLLAEPPPQSVRREPRWSPERARHARECWKAFVKKALETTLPPSD